VQFEFPWVLGPADGRYVLRAGPGEEARAVLVLATLGAPERRRLPRRRGRQVDPEPDPTPVPTARATVVDTADPLADETAGREWVRRAGEREAGEAIAALNLAIHAHRLARADPYVIEVSGERALVVRVGYGAGEEVAEGRWSEARELPPLGARRRRRTEVLRPQERLAAVLAGRDDPLACEELVLRARIDLDAGRHREAALQLSLALDAAVVELGRDKRGEGMAARVAELRERREEIASAARAALTGAPPADAEKAVSEAQERLEAALRARAVSGT